MVVNTTLWRCGCRVFSHGSLGLLGALGRAEQEHAHGQHQHQERGHRRRHQQDAPVGGPVPGGALCGHKGPGSYCEKHAFIRRKVVLLRFHSEGVKWSGCASDPTGYVVKVALGSCFCWPNNSKIQYEACVRDLDPAVKRHSSEAGTALRGRGNHTHTIGNTTGQQNDKKLKNNTQGKYVYELRLRSEELLPRAQNKHKTNSVMLLPATFCIATTFQKGFNKSFMNHKTCLRI